MEIKEVKLGAYRHFRGEEVELIALAKHTETLEDLAVYQVRDAAERADKKAYWVRPLEMFLEEVEHEGRRQPRFTYLGEGN